MKRVLIFLILVSFLFTLSCITKRQKVDLRPILQKINKIEQEKEQIKEELIALKKELDKRKKFQDKMKKNLAVKYNIPYIPEKVIFFGEPVPLEQFMVKERLISALEYEIGDSEMIDVFLRSGRWFPMIEKKIKSAGFSEDFKYLIVTESALKPTAGSYRGARGLAQFTRKTGKSYLTINAYIDERYDPEKAIEASINHLKDLYSELKNSVGNLTWSSVLACYNMNKDRFVGQFIKEKAKSFYNVRDIPLETRRYVFRMIAVKLIMENPEKYGYPSWETIDKIKYNPRLVEVRQIIVTRPKEKIIDLAQRLGMTYYEFRTFNPHILIEIRRVRISKGVYRYKVVRDWLPKGKYRIYTKRTS